MSDINERVGPFKSWFAQVDKAAQHGAFEGIDDKTIQLMGGMFPFGLDAFSYPKLRDYDPAEEIPVLIGEKPSHVFIVPFLKRVLPNCTLVDPYHELPSASGAVTVHHSIQKTGIEERMFSIPGLVYLNRNREQYAPQITAHEADHWKFYIIKPDTSQPAEVFTRSERQAHQTDLTVSLNIGSLKLNHVRAVQRQLKIARFSSMLERTAIARFAARVRKEYATEEANSLIADALSRAYGPEGPNEPATQDEVTAYSIAGLIAV